MSSQGILNLIIIFVYIAAGLVRDVKNIQRVLSGLKGAVDQVYAVVCTDLDLI